MVLARETKRFAAALLALQGLLTVAWWQWIIVRPEIRDYFFAPRTHGAILEKFAAPDLIVFAGGSIAASVLALRNSRFAAAAGWLVVGAAIYACVGAIAVNWPPGSVPLADALMTLTVANSALCAMMIGRSG